MTIFRMICRLQWCKPTEEFLTGSFRPKAIRSECAKSVVAACFIS